MAKATVFLYIKTLHFKHNTVVDNNLSLCVLVFLSDPMVSSTNRSISDFLTIVFVKALLSVACPVLSLSSPSSVLLVLSCAEALGEVWPSFYFYFSFSTTDQH